MLYQNTHTNQISRFFFDKLKAKNIRKRNLLVDVNSAYFCEYEQIILRLVNEKVIHVAPNVKLTIETHISHLIRTNVHADRFGTRQAKNVLFVIFGQFL